MTDAILCKICKTKMKALEFERYGPVDGAGLLRLKCPKVYCGFESTIRIFDKSHYEKVLSQVIVDLKTFVIFDFNEDGW